MRAATFVAKNDVELTNMAYRISGQGVKDRKFAKKMTVGFASLPIIAGTIVAAATKGKLSTKALAGTKGLLATAATLAVPLAVIDAHAAISKKSKKVANANEKHPILTFVGLIAAASLVMDGLAVLGHKIGPKTKETLRSLGKKVKLTSKSPSSLSFNRYNKNVFK